MKAKVWQEIKNLTEPELQLKLRENEEKLFRMKFKHATTPMKNGLEIRTLRRMIARIKTLMQEQTLNSKH
jgi:large subunit ribosomal protein L29